MVNLLPGVQSTTAALHAERVRLEVIAQNVANINTTRGVDGKAYQRQQVVFENVLDQAEANLRGLGEASGGPKVSRVITDSRPGRTIHMPGHPHADKQTGMVQFPNVNLPEEMADMIAASRAYEANLAVYRNARQVAMQTLSIGRR